MGMSQADLLRAALDNGQTQVPVVPVTLSDNQITMLVAAHLGPGYDAPEAVSRAIEILAESLAQLHAGALQRALQRAQERVAQVQQASMKPKLVTVPVT